MGWKLDGTLLQPLLSAFIRRCGECCVLGCLSTKANLGSPLFGSVINAVINIGI